MGVTCSSFAKQQLVRQEAAPSDDPEWGDAAQLEPLLTPEQWATYLALAVPGVSPDQPFVYAPPQLQLYPAIFRFLACGLDWYTPRSRCCAVPSPPCCGVDLVVSCIRCFDGGNVAVERISDPDRWFKKMLAARDPRCPKNLQGVYWFQDNNIQEAVVTLQDSDFQSARRFDKRGNFNWTHDYSCVGAIIAHPWIRSYNDPTQFEVSPDGKWVYIREPAFDAWAYVVQEGEVWRRTDGSILPTEVGDLIRQTTLDSFNPSSKQVFMYHLRRIATLDDKGEVRYLPGYDELRKLALAPDRHPGICCGYSHCCLTQAQIAEQWELANDRQIVRFAVDAPPVGSSARMARS